MSGSDREEEPHVNHILLRLLGLESSDEENEGNANANTK